MFIVKNEIVFHLKIVGMTGCPWAQTFTQSILSGKIMHTMNLDDIFSERFELPIIPRVTHELIEVLADERVSLLKVARRIDLDQVLTAKMLRLANSAYYGLQGKVSRVEDAVRMLGISTVHTLVLSLSLTSCFKAVRNVDLPNFWRHSLRVASVTRYLASEARGVDTNLAFTAGCLHAIGHLVMSSVMPDGLSRLNVSCPVGDIRRIEAEEGEFGYHYGNVSAKLASYWNFADELIAALSSFARPLDAIPFDPLSAVLHLGIWRVARDQKTLTRTDDFHPWPLVVGESVGISRSCVENMPSPAKLAAGLEGMIG